MLRQRVTERSRDAKLLAWRNAAFVKVGAMVGAMVGETEVHFFKHHEKHQVATEVTLEDSEAITERVKIGGILGGLSGRVQPAARDVLCRKAAEQDPGLSLCTLAVAITMHACPLRSIPPSPRPTQRLAPHLPPTLR
jgi:hypothetical protein